MSLQNLIENKLAKIDLTSVAKQMGYNDVDKLLTRMTNIVESPYLGLDESSFDFHYTTPEFIRKLCLVLEIKQLFCDTIISEIQVELARQKEKFKPYIFIETDFKRTTQPIHALAACENQRYISIDDNTSALALNEQLIHIQNLVKQHFQEQSELMIWGEVKKYVYFYDEHTILILSCTGKLVDAVTEYNASRALLSLKS